MTRYIINGIGFLTGVSALSLSAGAIAQTNMASGGQEAAIPDIVVTAQKRSESINRVGMSITAATGEALEQRGVASVSDLVKLVPGFNATTVQGIAPVYLIRGVGLVDPGLASSPAVSVYLDQVPFASASMTKLPPLDLERVEVLKGPQGTLFGQNSTGGGVNFIAAKPTDEFEAGGSIAYERFGKVSAQGYVSVPLTATLGTRVAVGITEGGAWQRSLTRPDDSLGASRTRQGRLILDWKSDDRLKALFSITVSHDSSDTQAAQLVRFNVGAPALVQPAFLASPLSPGNARSADWAPGLSPRSDNDLVTTSLRLDYDLSSVLTLTSISAYQHYRKSDLVDNSGVAIGALAGGPQSAGGQVAFIETAATYFGKLSDFNQELRLSADLSGARLVVGGNYDRQRVTDGQRYVQNSTIAFFPPQFGNHFPAAVTRSKIEQWAIFGNADIDLADGLTLHAGARYTRAKRDADSCTFAWNPGADNPGLPDFFNFLQGALAAGGVKTSPVKLVSGTDCLALSAAPDLTPSNVVNGLDEDNISYRLGIDYKTPGGTLLYANISQGYKSGIITPLAAATQASYIPATQEKLVAYEAGFKAPLLSGHARLNAALFYYDYSDKQLYGFFTDPLFGATARLINIPKSTVKGAELEFQASPIPGLTMSVAGTYLDAKVTSHFLFQNGEFNYGDFKGSGVPYTPKWQGVSDAQYEWALSDGLRAFVGGSVAAQSASYSTFANDNVPAPTSRLKAWTTLDLRVGVGAPDDRWRVTLFGNNVTNTLRVTTANNGADTFIRLTGMPTTYGLRLNVKI